MARSYALEPLDTLSPIPALAADQPDLDPLAGLRRIAIIQPRGLSASDNVAVDGWVRAGGRLLLVLDPALTGEYDLPLGDPRRPVDTALIPPVANAWGGPTDLEPRDMQGDDDPFAHVIAGDILSPGQTEPVIAIITEWARGL